jgi:hypothetical protein
MRSAYGSAGCNGIASMNEALQKRINPQGGNDARGPTSWAIERALYGEIVRFVTNL